MGARILTAAQVEQAVAWRESGWSYKRIAERFGVTSGAINYQCLKHGAVSPNQFRLPVPTAASTIRTSTGRTLTKFTQADDERLLELEAQGLSYPAIARVMGRAYTSVRMRLLTLATHEDLPMKAPR